jgi:nucleotide-binding universal stress UspA family protein
LSEHLASLATKQNRIRKQMNTLIENKFDLEQGLPPPGWKTVLAPVDFSPASARATRLAAEIAQQNGGKLVLLHVIAPPPGSEDADFCFLDEAERQAAARLSQWLATNVKDCANDTDTSVRASASLEFTILLEARRVGADVIVLSGSCDAMLGARSIVWRDGTPASRGALFRARAQGHGILRHASCPIITVNGAFPKRRVRHGSEHGLTLT